jgi:formylglycine-generating enzyme required for sulfatase activity
MSQLTITKHPASIHYFTEALGDQVELDMVLIPAGRFEMGSPADEPERRDSEGPQHLVMVPTFFMGRTPITQAQWRQVARLAKVKTELEEKPSRAEGDNRPVERVSWDDATEFCARLSRYTKREYGLPSEAEWEYALVNMGGVSLANIASIQLLSVASRPISLGCTICMAMFGSGVWTIGMTTTRKHRMMDLRG